jgi:hypothetical protein
MFGVDQRVVWAKETTTTQEARPNPISAEQISPVQHVGDCTSGKE